MFEALLGKTFTRLLLKLIEVAEALLPVLLAYLRAKTAEARVGVISDKENALVEALEVGREDEVGALFDELDRELDGLLPGADRAAPPDGAGAERDHEEPGRDVDGDGGLDGADVPGSDDLRGGAEDTDATVIDMHHRAPRTG